MFFTHLFLLTYISYYVIILLEHRKEDFRIYEQMLSAYHALEQKLSLLQSQLEDLPEGKLICSHNGPYSKWYRSNGQNKTYISKKNRCLAEQLALKKFLSLQIQAIQKEKRAIQFYLDHHCSFPDQAERFLACNSEYRKLLSTYFHSDSQQLDHWSKESYQNNPAHPEQLIHKSASGHLVRSKSEALIDMLLYTNRIPFRYESALQISGTLFFPDFTIRHPKTGQLFYWEHFGLMDLADYSQKAFSKLQFYTTHGIIPSVNLITTYETRDAPLQAELVEKIITYYFL